MLIRIVDAFLTVKDSDGMTVTKESQLVVPKCQGRYYTNNKGCDLIEPVTLCQTLDRVLSSMVSQSPHGSSVK